MEITKVETVRFAQAVNIDGVEELFASTNLPKHRHLTMNWEHEEKEGHYLKIVGKKEVRVNVNNCACWVPDKKPDAAEEITERPVMHIPPKPPKNVA